MTSIDLASNSALLQVAEKLAEQNALLGKVAIRGESAFIRYSAYADGTDFTETWSAGQNYIGHATGLEAPTDKEGYTWSLFASNIRETLTVTLKKNDWLNNTQIIETVQLGETGSVFPSPKPESQEAYLEAGIVISAATDNALVFTCLEVPEIDLVVDIQVTEPLAVIGGTGVSSWNELLDKPFGEERVESQVIIEYDGSTEGKTTAEAFLNTDGSQTANGYFVKVSELTPSATDLVGAAVKGGGTQGTDYETDALPSECIKDYKDDNNYAVIDIPHSSESSHMYAAFIIAYDEVDVTYGVTIDSSAADVVCHIPSAGIWAQLNADGGYSSYLSYSSTITTIKKLDSKYLPDDIANKDDLQVLQDALDAYITDINALIGGDE